MNLLAINHMDAVMMCGDRDPDPPNTLGSDKVKFFTLNDIITSPSVNRTLSDSVTRGEGGCFRGKVH